MTMDAQKISNWLTVFLAAYLGMYFPGYSFLDEYRSNDSHVWLLKGSDGTRQLAAVEKNILFDDYRVADSVTLTEDAYSDRIWGDSLLINLEIGENAIIKCSTAPLSIRFPSAAVRI